MGTFKGLIMLPFTLVIYVLAVLVFNLIHAIPTLDYAFAALRFTRRLGVSRARARAEEEEQRASPGGAAPQPARRVTRRARAPLPARLPARSPT